MKEFYIWRTLTINAFQQALSNKVLFLLFFLSKIIRIVMFFLFLNFLLLGTKSLGGYSQSQIIFFYLTFNVVDTAAQFLFREVYRFRQLVVTGTLDFILMKPFNSLIRVLIGGSDFIDLFILLMIIFVTYFYG